MPSPVHVKKAQQRYAMVPVLNEDGTQKETPVFDKKTGKQKVTKHGKPVTMKVTVTDKSQPLEMPKCDYGQCTVTEDKTIEVGTPYKHLTVKTGPYSSRTYTRHEQCPSWNIWEYNFSTSANVARVQSDMGDVLSAAEFAEESDFDSVRDDLAQMAQELCDEKQESLDGMPEGLAEGSELQEQVSALEAWAEAIGEADAPDFPDPEEVERWFVVNTDGTGDVLEEGFEAEDEAEGAMAELISTGFASEGEVEVESREETLEEPTEEQVDEWADECRSVLEDAINECEL